MCLHSRLGRYMPSVHSYINRNVPTVHCDISAHSELALAEPTNSKDTGPGVGHVMHLVDYMPTVIHRGWDPE